MASTNEKEPLFARVSHHFEQPRERVFDAWIDPALLHRWLSIASEGKYPGKLGSIQVDARPGGTFTFTYHREGGDIAQKGEYLEVTRPAHLSFTWAMALPDIERVVIDFAPAPHGCEVTITHVMDPGWTGDISPVAAAWGGALAAIDMTLRDDAKRTTPG